MKTLTMLLLAIRILKLNLKVVKQLGAGAELSTLEKDYSLLMVLIPRLLSALKAKVSGERIKSGATTAPKRASRLG